MNDVKKTLNALSRRQLALLSEKLKEKAVQAPKHTAQPKLERRQDRSAPFRLSFAQQRLWFIDQMEPGNNVYNCPGAVTLGGELDLSALEKALNEIVRRHESLRTRIEVNGGEPVQAIDQWEPRKLEAHDLTGLTRRQKEAEVERLASEEAGAGFNLSRGPLFRAKILKLAEDEHVLLYTMHHIISDQWSVEIMFREVVTLYQSYLAGEESPLPELEIQYVDYAEWQRKYLVGGVLEREVGYWKDRLKGAAVLELPADYPRPAAPSYRGGRVRVEIDEVTHQSLRLLAREEDVTIFMILMAAFKVVLMKYSHEEDISVGTVIANRTMKEVEPLIGFFLNTLVIRTDLSGNPGFRQLLGREREAALGAYAHQEAPFEKLLEEISPERDPSRSPLFQVMMEMQTAKREEAHAQGVSKGLSVNRLGKKTVPARFDLTLGLTEYPGGVSGNFIYSRDLFDEETVGRMADHYERVVKAVVEGADKMIHEIQLLSRIEREQILMKWNETAVEYPRSNSIQELFEAQAEETPERVAIVCGKQEASYRDLNQRANRLAHFLRRLGVGPELPVGICVSRSVDLIVGLLGILKAGGAYLAMDPASPAEQLRYMLEDGKPLALLTEERLLSGLPEFSGTTLRLDRDWKLMADESDENPEPTATDENPAYVIYTSGSTGQPKGVMGLHKSSINRFAWMWGHYPFQADDVACQKTSLCFVDSVWEIFGPLLQGVRAIIVEDAVARDTAGLMRTLQLEQVSRVVLVPSLLRSMLDHIDDVPGGFPQLKYCVSSGEALPAQLSEAFSEKLPGSGLLNLYGSSEVSADVTWHEISGKERGPVVPLGRPIANTQIYLLDSQLQPAPIGVAGELCVGGQGLARGYLNRPDLTAERFLPTPYGDGCGGRLYKTGDLGRYLGDGKIEYLKRIDHQVKIRGYRIELGEIEAQLGTHPAVRQCVVMADRNEAEETYLTAYVVCEGERAPSSVELRNYLKDRMPEHMSPAWFVRLKEMPLLPSGKVDRMALRASESKPLESRDAFLTPQTPVEQIVVGIYEEVLDRDQVGRNEDFFAIGGHSLLATKVVIRVRKALGVDIGVKDIFKKATAEGLARLIEEAMRKGKKDEAPPLVRVSRGESLPLSFAQQRLWFIDQLVPNNPSYNISRALRIEGEFDLDILERVINEIVRRHEMLRTRIEIKEGAPTQVVDEWAPRKLEVKDLTRLPRDQREEEASRIVRDEAEAGFDLSLGPMLRVKVLKLGEEERLLLYTMHHIVSDGWSMGILRREVAALYQAYSAGEASPLADLPVQYADFAVWQKQWLQGPVLAAEIEYWRNQLRGMQELDLPTDHPRPAAQSYRGSSRRFVVERELAEKLRTLSRREGVTLFMTLLAGFDVLMARYSGQEDVALGTDIANRNRTEIEGLIGFFVNQLALRVAVKPRESFRELLKRVREVCLGAYAHQDLPFEKLVEELNPERDLSRSPLFQVKMLLQEAPGEKGGNELERVRVSSGGGELRSVRFDLTVDIMDRGQALFGTVEYSRDLFEAETIERLIDHYTNVLQGVAKDSESPVCRLGMLSESERKRIVEEWNATEANYPKEKLIHELFEEQVESCPQAVALVCEGRNLTYSELNMQANRLAWRLRRLGVGPESLVGVCLERSLEMVIGLLATLKAGAAYLPLDPAYPVDRIVYMLEDAQVGVLLTDRKLSGRLPANGFQIVALDADWALIGAESVENLPQWSTPGNPAYAIYTSGSTGRPKGVLVPHRQAINFFTAMDAELKPDPAGVWLAVTSISFDISVLELLWTLARGFQVVTHGAGEAVSPATEIIKHQVTHLQCAPSMAKMISMGAEWIGAAGSLRKLIIGGEAFPQDLAERLRGVVKGEIRNMYGPTETTVWSTTHALNGAEKSVPIGRPVANTRIYILDQALEIAPVGVIGELYIGGEGVARGYLNQPAVTGERFMPDARGLAGGERVYRTGDLARYRNDGRIEFLGRVDHQVKIRGYRIELGEIETRLGSHPGVRQCVVTACEEEAGDKRLVAYLVKDGEREPSDGELRSYLQERLPEYMTPSWFVRLEELPLTPNGKVDRRALPAPNMKRAEGVDGYRGPRTAVEEIVIGIFEEVLKVDGVGRKGDFFELGGHSLLATQAISRVRKMLGVEIGVRSVFEGRTVEDLSRKIEEALKAGKKDETPPLVKVSRERRLPLSFAQQRLWFIDQLDPAKSVYNNPGSVRLKGVLDLDALERVVNGIFSRHEVLRTRIVVDSGEPAQAIDAWSPRRLEVVDLSGLSREERIEEAGRRAREEAETGFDLSQGPLLRVKVLKLEEDDHLLLYTIHHIVSDEWSMGILIREVGALYRAYLEGEAALLPDLPVQYADFAVWQREWLQGATLDAELGYWRKRLAGMEPLELPTDHSRSTTPSYRGANRRFVIESELAEKLRALGKREGLTLFMTLLAGFDVLMSRYSGQSDVALGTDIANRNRTEIEGLIGFFVNQLVMRVEVRPEESFRELLNRVREVCLGAYGHQDLPFEKLVEELQPERDLSRSPFFQVKMILQNAPVERLELGGVELSGRGVGDAKMGNLESPARFDLTVFIRDDGQDLIGVMNYSRDLFEPETIDRLMSHYTNVLRTAVEDGERRISWLSLLSVEEREQIVVEWNETGSPYPKDRCVHDLITEQSECGPDRVALMYEMEQVSYGELNRRANQLGNYLQRLGVGPDVVVGMCLPRSVEMVVALLGTLKAGGCYLPMDPESPLERLSYMMEDAVVGVALTVRELEGRLPAFWGQTICLDSDWERIGAESESEPLRGVEPENLAYVIYTSGSTGRPKGVMINHGGVVNYLRWATEAYRIGEGVGAPVSSPISFDLTVTSLYGSLVNGKRAHLLSEREGLDALATAMKLEREYSLVKITPSHLDVLAEQLGDLEAEGRTRAMVIGGEELKTKGLRYWLEKAQGTRLINEYGPTETVVGCCVYEVNEARVERETTPIGKPIANTGIYVLDQELEPAPIGVKGVIYISGAGLARGYVGSAELTAEKFIPNSFGGKVGERLYGAGDIGRRLADGNIEYAGRADNQVKIRGYRIELGEIEATLNEHGMVRQSVVVAEENERGDKRLIAYVVGDEAATPKDLKRYLLEKLPEYMAPEAILILEEIPLTANGKIDRRRLPSAPDAVGHAEREHAGARTAVEEIVIGIFEDVLKIDGVGRKDDFFELGGHSLLATQAISRVRNAFNVALGLRSIFDERTAEGLAGKIEEAIKAGEKDQTPPLVRVSREQRLPLSFAQQRLWFINQLEPGSALYNIPGAIRLEGSLNLGALERSVNEIVRRHEVLRTRIVVESGEPAQVIDPWEPRGLEVIDLTDMTQEETKVELGRRAREEAETGFDLSRGPLLRVKVLKLEEKEYAVIYTMHHIVSDAWSEGVLIGEVGQLYQAYSAGDESPLEELEIQYADYAAWQRNWLQGATLERQLNYWKRQLKGAPAALELPIARRRPSIQSHRGERQSLALPAELTAKLADLNRRQNVTLFMTLLAAFQTLLYRYSWQEDIVVGTAIANRNRQETERLLGFFVNLLALRTDLSGNPTFTELLGRVREVALGAYAHQDVPFDLIVDELRLERDLKRTPLIQVVFGVENAPTSSLELSETRLAPLKTVNETARFDMTMGMVETPQGLMATLEYDTDLFEASAIANMLKRYAALLEAIAANPDRRVLEIPLQQENEKYVAPASSLRNKSVKDRLESENFLS
jgi:amino acid adenylation domain-containing protein